MKFGRRNDIHSIALENVTLREPNGVVWFEDVSMYIKPGESIWFKGEVVGTHLLKVIAGLTLPTKGRVLINGKSIHEMDFEEFLPYRLNLGYTFNLGGILNNRTIKENLMLPFLYHGAPVDYAEQEVQEIIKLFDLIGHHTSSSTHGRSDKFNEGSGYWRPQRLDYRAAI
jgi:ABC-type ATPase involved in cell division